MTGTWTPLVGIGILLGTAWAVVYTATPMVMSEVVTDEARAAYFGYLTGTQQVGIGAGPVVAHVLVETDPTGRSATDLAILGPKRRSVLSPLGASRAIHAGAHAESSIRRPVSCPFPHSA